MKKTILLLWMSAIVLFGQAQVSKTVNVGTAGTLSSLLTSTDKSTITNLTVTGTIDARDFKTIRDEMTDLQILDLKEANIIAFNGTGGTYPYQTYYSFSYKLNEIPTYAFQNKNKLTKITLPNSVTSIGTYAFDSCSGLTAIDLPASVISICGYAFNNCTNLTMLVIPASVTTLADCFLAGSSIKTLTVKMSAPALTTSKTFYDFNLSLCTLEVPAGSLAAYLNADYWKLFLGIIESGSDPAIKTVNVNTPGTLNNLLTSTDRSTITNLTVMGKIDARDFSTLRSMTKLTILDLSMANIQAYNGEGGTYWETYSYSANEIPIYSFKDNGNHLTNLVLPNSLTSIASGAFCGCTGLTSIFISSLINNIKSEAFENCTNLRITVDPNNPYYMNSDDVLFNKDQTLLIFSSALKTGSYTIPSSVTSIGIAAFYGNKNLTSINIPSSVTSMGIGAFYGCEGLTSITIPSSVTNIGIQTFESCKGLTTINIPSSVTAIRDYAFANCIGLTSINIPSSVTSIGNDAFEYCSGLTSVTIPSLVTSIGDYTFQGCTNLTSVIIPTTVKSIGDHAFSSCSSLKDITIPALVTSIGNNAFYYCKDLTSIYAYSETPITLNSSSTFYMVNKNTCILYVPSCSINLYKTASVWKDFYNIVEMTTAVPALSDESISIYPNPATDALYISGINGTATLRLLDVNSRLFIEKQVADNEPISVSLLPQSLYIAKLITSKGTVERKIIKK